MLFLSTLSLAAALGSSLVSADRTITTTNLCPYTIYPAMYTDLNVSPSKPGQPTGWTLDPNGGEHSFQVPEAWNGRIWGRRDCNFDGSGLPSTCVTGGCNGGYYCDQEGGTGVPPTTVAEFTLNGGANGNTDNYDVSLVDGFDNPMKLEPSTDCMAPNCNVDINSDCPAELQVKNENGYVIGCNSACKAGLSGNPGNSPNCCSGDYDKPETCPSSGVQYYDFFKNKCPNTYAYAYDEGSGTALWKCSSTDQPNYKITFCPP